MDAFELNIREFFGSRRNKSDLTIESCFRYNQEYFADYAHCADYQSNVICTINIFLKK